MNIREIRHTAIQLLTTAITFHYRNDDETSSKHGDDDEEVRSTKDEDRPSSSGLLHKNQLKATANLTNLFIFRS